MTTAQESTNGHRVSPPPCSFPDSQDEIRSKDSTNNLNSVPLPPTPTTEPFPASAYHVPPSRFAPKAYSYRYDDTLDLPPETEPQPERCQFMFSDGRQCTMARSDIHPSLCTYHSDREEQLFGDPGGSFVTRKLDLPELYSACRDLTTAVGVNRALGQVFRLLAQHRISRQEAATFAKLGHLLLRTISDMPAESVAADNHHGGAGVILSEQRRISQSTSHSVAIRSSGKNDNPAGVVPRNEPERDLCPQPAPQHNNAASEPQPVPTNAHPSAAPMAPAAVSQAVSQPTATNKLTAINTSATPVCNSGEISTYENVELKPVQNQHLQKRDQAACGFKPRQGRQNLVRGATGSPACAS
jgi:hypothetical protein